MDCPRIAVFHLVRQQNNISLFKNFIQSYLRFESGSDHQLIIIFKGFSEPSEIEAYTELLVNIPHIKFEVSDQGFDITAYDKASRHFFGQYDYYCFLNSHSIILASEWLGKLVTEIEKPNVGMVGATGSYQSHRGSARFFLIILSALQFSLFSLFKNELSFRAKLLEIKSISQHLMFLTHFTQFPNPHLRTNGFLIRPRDMVNSLRNKIKTKKDAYIYESGKSGLSNYIVNQGLKLVVVGQNGKGYNVDEWKNSQVYVDREQENLLISDNMTRRYAQKNNEDRQNLKNMCWSPVALYIKPHHWRKVIRAKHNERMIKEQQRALMEYNNEKREVIIYGAGELGDFFQNWIQINTKSLTISAFIDARLRGNRDGIPILPPSSLEKTMTIDIILISSKAYYDEIYRTLIDAGVPSQKII